MLKNQNVALPEIEADRSLCLVRIGTSIIASSVASEVKVSNEQDLYADSDYQFASLCLSLSLSLSLHREAPASSASFHWGAFTGLPESVASVLC